MGRAQDSLVQFLNMNMPIPLAGKSPVREHAEDGRLRLANEDNEAGIGKTVEHQSQSVIVDRLPVPDFFESPARCLARAVSEKRPDEFSKPLLEFRFATEIIPSGPPARVPQFLDPMLRAQARIIREPRVPRFVIRCGNLPQKPVVFTPDQEPRVGVQDGL